MTSLSDGTVFKYDANGNMVSLAKGSNTTTYTYDVQNRLQKVTVGALTVAVYLYDGDGARTEKTVYRRDLALYNENVNPLLFGNTVATASNQNTDTTIAVGNLYETESGVSRNSKFIYLGSTRVASVGSDGSVLYYHTDHLGGSNVVSDSTGALRELSTYDPYGQVFAHNKFGSSFATIWWYFTGKPMDDETGLIFLGARYYNPQLGRFITPDTVVPYPGNPQSLNRYTYCGNNPINAIDPSGHKHHNWWKSFWHKVSGFFGMVVGAIVGIVAGPIAGLAAYSAIAASGQRGGFWGNFGRDFVSSLGLLSGNPYFMASSAFAMYSSAIGQLGGRVAGEISQGLGYASLAAAAVGGLQEIAGAFSQATSATASTAQATKAASSAGSTGVTAGSSIAANAPYYQSGDLVKAFNDVNSSILEKVNVGQMIASTASKAGTASFTLASISAGFEKAATAGWGMVGTGLFTAASGVAANLVPGVGEVFDVEFVTQNALLVAKVGGWVTAASDFGSKIISGITSGSYWAAVKSFVGSAISERLGYGIGSTYGEAAGTVSSSLYDEALQAVSKN